MAYLFAGIPIQAIQYSSKWMRKNGKHQQFTSLGRIIFNFLINLRPSARSKITIIEL
jgi:hypothetical protein